MSSPNVDSVELLDEDEQPVQSTETLGPVSAERRSVWSSRLSSECDPPPVPADELVAVRCVGGRGSLEHAVRVPSGGAGAASPLLLDCKVSYEPLPPSSLVEYRFADGDGKWRLSMVCLEYLLAFRSGKFADWEKRVLAPTCAAEFRRMVGIGPVFQVYDHHMFPSPEDEKGDYEVTDDRGRKVILPRPVAELRIWSTEKQAYEAVDPTLDGCPALEERGSYWTGVLEKLREQFPEEIDGIIGAKEGA
jgi:hypothetical protein